MRRSVHIGKVPPGLPSRDAAARALHAGPPFRLSP